jgi:glycosyltransferase involved in cell wall biosynthesis
MRSDGVTSTTLWLARSPADSESPDVRDPYRRRKRPRTVSPDLEAALDPTAMPAPGTLRAKKVGFLVSQYPAPSHTFIRREVHALRRRGLSVDTFSIRPPKANERLSAVDREEEARTFYVLPARPLALLAAHFWAFRRRPVMYVTMFFAALHHRVPGVRALFWSFFYFIEAMALARELSRRDIAHLHNHFANSGATVGMLSCRYLGIGWSLTLHGISEFDYPSGLLLTEKLAHAQFAACVSSFGMAQAMRTIAPADWTKLLISRCGLELAAMPAPQTRPPGPPRVVCVGRLSAEKGHLGLIEAFAALLARGQVAQLRLVGDGPDRARIEAAIARHGIGAHVVLRGQLPEDETLVEVGQADVLVSASFMEGLPVVLMEALAYRVAVVAPRIAGVPELVEDGVTGLLFTPADWAGLTAAMARALSDPALRERLGRAGYERVRAEFDASRACEPLAQRLSDESDGDTEDAVVAAQAR